MNHLLLQTCFIMSLGVLLPQQTQTASIYVSRIAAKDKNCGKTRDDPCSTIRAALNVATASSEITIMNADSSTTPYDECPIIVTKPFTFTGIRGTPVIDCKGKADGFLINIDKMYENGTVLVVKINNLRVRNARTGIYFGTRSKLINIRIADVKFEDNIVDLNMRNSPLCYLNVNNVVANGSLGDGLQLDSCETAKVFLTDTEFHGKKLKIVSIKNNLEFHMKNVTLDLRARLNTPQSESLSAVYIETTTGNTSINIQFSKFLNHAGKTRGSVFIESPKTLSKKLLKKINNAPKLSIVVKMVWVAFLNNSVAAGNGGAFSFNTTLNTKQSKPASLIFTNCTFRRNSAYAQGGALWFGKWKDKTTRFTDCKFEENVAYGSENGSGGAFYHTGGKIILDSCRFQGNMASTTGGALHVEGPSSLIIKDTSFKNNRNSRKGTLGDVVYIKQKPTIFTGNVTFDLESSNSQEPIFLFQGRPHVLIMSNATRFICPAGYNYQELVADTTKIRHRFYHSFGFKCVPCKDLFYTVSRGYYQVDGKSYVSECHKCPYGASCNGTIRSRKGFWGVIYNGKVDMVSCPRGYCCDHEPCRGYNSCHKNRIGTLCGQCKEGFSEGLGSTTCLPNKHCGDAISWIWLVVSVILVFLFFLFQQELMTYSSKLLLWTVKTEVRQYRPETRIHETDSEDSTERIQLHTNSLLIARPSNPQPPDYERVEESASFNENSGYLKVLFYFYQVVTLLRFSPYSAPSSSPDTLIQTFLPFLSFQFTEFSSFCLKSNLTPVPKTVFKNTFGLWVLGLALVSYTGYRFLRFMRMKVSYSEPIDAQPAFIARSFPVRLTGAVMQVILLSYTPLSLLTVQLLDCVEVGEQYVLSIDGSFVCYDEPIQRFAWFFLINNIIAFPLVLLVGRRLLVTGHLSPARFIAACLLPLAFLSYWTFLYWHEGYGQHNHQSHVSGRNAYKDKILYILQHPYKEASSTRTLSKRLSEKWESILMFRRLVLLLAYVFTPSYLLRANLLFMLSLVFLLLHAFVQPFLNTKVNMVETISLSLIVWFAGSDIAYAAFSAAESNRSSSLAEIKAIQDWFVALLPFVLILVSLGPRIKHFFHCLCKKSATSELNQNVAT